MALEKLHVTRRALRIKATTIPKELHPELLARVRGLMMDLDNRFCMWTGYRDKAAQERAFQTGKSQARWLQSPHNYKPALAVDLVLNPDVVDVAPNDRDPRWPNLWDKESPQALKAWFDLELAAIDHHLKRVVLRSGPDLPHLELPAWRSYAS